MTCNMKLRKKIYDTHSLHKKRVVIMEKNICPTRLEICVRSLLYDKRYKNRKDFYLCSFSEVKRAVDVCKKSIRSMRTVRKQTGGSKNAHAKNVLLMHPVIVSLKNDRNILRHKILKLNKKILI